MNPLEENDLDVLRDVYMTNTQRAAFNRIVSIARDADIDPDTIKRKAAFRAACYELVDAVEGELGAKLAASGARFKDTTAWARFYVLVTGMRLRGEPDPIAPSKSQIRAIAERVPGDLTAGRIIELRDKCLPDQGGPFDCIAFAREVEAEVRAELAAKPGDALCALEEYALYGGVLQGDDALRFRATVDRMAPLASAPACPECAAAVLYECPACSATNYPEGATK